jgi:tetratricopeptide (TPR) repeat protein
MDESPRAVFHSLDRDAEIEVSQRNLPHWFQVGSAVFITFRTADSWPREVLERRIRELEAWLTIQSLPRELACSLLDAKVANHHQLMASLDASHRRELQKRADQLIHGALDGCWGACLLRQSDLASIVAETLFPIMEKIHHGLPVSNADQFQWSKSLVAYYEVYARENPTAPLAARRLVTAYHEAANAASRVGDGPLTGTFRAKSIEQILQLGARDPTNAVWRFKLVMALIQFTHDSQFLGPPYETPEDREPLLQSAKMLIDQLVLEQPDNITYRDVQNAIRFRLCGMGAMLGREGDDYEPELVQLIESSESLWSDHPDQPLLAKYAVEARWLLAQFHLKHGRRESACRCIEDSLRVCDSAYGPYASEEWAREIEYTTLYQGSSVFVSAGRFASALANLERLLALDDELRKSNRLDRARMTAAIDFRAMKVQSLLGLQRLHEAKWAHRDWWRSIDLAVQSQEIDPSEYFELRCNDPFNKLSQLVMP